MWNAQAFRDLYSKGCLTSVVAEGGEDAGSRGGEMALSVEKGSALNTRRRKAIRKDGGATVVQQKRNENKGAVMTEQNTIHGCKNR